MNTAQVLLFAGGLIVLGVAGIARQLAKLNRILDAPAPVEFRNVPDPAVLEDELVAMLDDIYFAPAYGEEVA